MLTSVYQKNWKKCKGRQSDISSDYHTPSLLRIITTLISAFTSSVFVENSPPYATPSKLIQNQLTTFYRNTAEEPRNMDITQYPDIFCSIRKIILSHSGIDLPYFSDLDFSIYTSIKIIKIWPWISSKHISGKTFSTLLQPEGNKNSTFIKKKKHFVPKFR